MTRIPQLEEELVAAAGRLQSPRRLVRPAVRAALAAAALVAVVVLTLVGTADDDGDRRARPSGASSPPPNLDLVDREAGVRFALDGRMLTVRLLASAPSKTRERVNGARIRATCGETFTEGPGPGPGLIRARRAHALGRPAARSCDSASGATSRGSPGGAGWRTRW